MIATMYSRAILLGKLPRALETQGPVRPGRTMKKLTSMHLAAAGLVLAVGGTVLAESPIVKPVYIFAHAGGARAYAPDNSMPTMDYAMTLGVTGIEIDMRITKDGHIVLIHDDLINVGDPQAPVLHWAGGGAVAAGSTISALTLQEVKRLRYKGQVDGRPQELRIVPADEAIAKFKERTNFFLDVKSVPAQDVLQLIARHDIVERSVVLALDLDYLRKVRAADPRISLCYFTSMPEDPGKARELVEEVAGVGVEMFGSHEMTEAKVKLWHEYGITARPSGNMSSPNNQSILEGFFKSGMDGMLPVHPKTALEAVKATLGTEYLPKENQTIYDLLHPADPLDN